jgi:RNA polymerase sigma factor (TIGR02999 family)
VVNRATPPAPADASQLLRRWTEGDPRALDQVTSVVYHELKRLAQVRLQEERTGHTLNTTGLVHEAYLRLVDIEQVEWRDQNHFLSMASRVMRRVLVDHARARNADKRGGGARDVTLREEHLVVTAEQADTVLALDEAVSRLEAAHPRPGRVVELYYFGGLLQEEVAEVLGVSQPTVHRDLQFAVAWLEREWRDS